jgi:hypothetical protein
VGWGPGGFGVQGIPLQYLNDFELLAKKRAPTGPEGFGCFRSTPPGQPATARFVVKLVVATHAVLMGIAMPQLKFVCPVTGKTVDTGVDIDEDSFACLRDDTELGCPHCAKPHRIDEIAGWLLGDIEPQLE